MDYKPANYVSEGRTNEMNEMTLEGLLRAGYSYYARNVANFMIIEVQVGNSRPEIIINHRENFEAKLDYYSKAYDQSLRLKANPDIRIVRYNFVETLMIIIKGKTGGTLDEC